MFNSETLMPVQRGLTKFVSSDTPEQHILLAATAMAVLPVIILYTVAQRSIIQGIMEGAVKAASLARRRGRRSVIFNSPENVRALTHLAPYERFDDGRPSVPDDLLERLALATNDEAWAIVTRKHGYQFPFAGAWPVHLQPDRVLVGRAVTAAFVPLRPDLNAAVEARGEPRGGSGRHNAWVIEALRKGDVAVVDLFGKIRNGTFIGRQPGDGDPGRTGRASSSRAASATWRACES